MIHVQVLGPGCAKCKKLTAQVMKVVSEHQLDVEFEKVTDIIKIAEFGIVATPSLVVDGKVVVSGRVPSESEIQEFLK
jgi:small redox-active disulfide protein 2